MIFDLWKKCGFVLHFFVSGKNQSLNFSQRETCLYSSPNYSWEIEWMMWMNLIFVYDISVCCCPVEHLKITNMNKRNYILMQNIIFKKLYSNFSMSHKNFVFTLWSLCYFAFYEEKKNMPRKQKKSNDHYMTDILHSL